jgi:quercetin dioxygenase-like cupin family protein
MHPQVLQKNEGPAFWFLNSLILVKSTPASTGSPSAILHQTIPPGFSTPYHCHRASDDTFCVLEGEVTFFSDGQKIILGPGGYIFLPHGFPHGFRNDTEEPASLLFVTTPGEDFLGFMQEAGEPAKHRTLPEPTAPDRARLAALSSKWGVDVLGPLPG